MIEIKDLHKSYKMGNSKLHVLKGVNFNIKEGELVAIMGSSGSGKSTLLNILGILDEADEGSYTLDNVAMPLYYQGVKRKERYELAMHYLEKVGLATHAHHLPSELSGGQKQRVAIARALASNPKVLLADEPTGALDTKTSYEVMELIQGINDEGKTILIVTHEPDIAAMCKRNVVLKDGLIIDDKMVNQVRANLYV